MQDSSTRASRLEHLRAAADLTIEQLAEKANLSPETVRKLEKGQVDRPRLRTLYRLAGALGVPVADLLDSEEGAA